MAGAPVVTTDTYTVVAKPEEPSARTDAEKELHKILNVRKVYDKAINISRRLLMEGGMERKLAIRAKVDMETVISAILRAAIRDDELGFEARDLFSRLGYKENVAKLCKTDSGSAALAETLEILFADAGIG